MNTAKVLLVAGFSLCLASCRYDYDALRAGTGMGGGGGGTGGSDIGVDGTGGLGGPGSGGAGPAGGGTGGAGTGGSGTGGRAAGGNGGGGAGGRGQGLGGAGGTAGTGTEGPVIWYRFDDGSGMSAVDSSGRPGASPAMLATLGDGQCSFSTTRQVGTHAVQLLSSGSTGGGYVVIPSLAALAPSAVTIAAWVHPTAAQMWQRVFDLGNGTMTNVSLTTQDSTGTVRFAIRANANLAEIINTTMMALPNTWYHLAVVLRAGAPYTGEVYVNGAVAGSNPAMTLHLSDLGATANNFLGRSQYASDPYFSGYIDDFRVYNRALRADEIAAIYQTR